MIYYRSDCCSDRLINFTLSLLKANNEIISTKDLNGEQVQTIEFM